MSGLRRAVPEDASSLQLLAMETFLEAFGPAIPPKAMSQLIETRFTLDRFETELSAGVAEVFLAEEEGNLVGYAVTVPNGLLGTVGDGAWELSRIYLRRSHQGRGLGDALMQACVDAASAAGARSLWLKVWEGNARGRAFYRRWDFKGIGHEDMDLFGTMLPHLILERAL